ncbi:MAG: alpha-ketoacid dehydrogenase subunit beta, partial [bacterium]
YSVPIVVRAIIGRSWGQGAQHSQSFHSYFMHVPGLKVVAPTTPHDAKGCMIAAIRDNSPVIFVEHRMLYNNKGLVPEHAYTVPFGHARTLTHGDGITIVAVSHMVVEAVRAYHHLLHAGIHAEVIDPVSLTPLDMETVISSVERTGRLLVVDNSWTTAGASAEIVASTVEHFQGSKSLKMRRMGFALTPCPTTKPLENLFYPNARTIAAAAFEMVHARGGWVPDGEEAREIAEFKGPF